MTRVTVTPSTTHRSLLVQFEALRLKANQQQDIIEHLQAHNKALDQEMNEDYVRAENYKEALESIIKHQEIVAGGTSKQ